MGELSRQLLAWIARLLPKQKVQGHGAIQVGKVGGNLTIFHVTQAPSSTRQESPTLANQEQRAVLGMIRRLRNSEAVFEWMQKSFGTRMVIDLDARQLLRVRRYVESIHRRMSRRGKP